MALSGADRLLVFALTYPDITRLTPEKAAIVSTALLMVLAMIFGYRGKRLGLVDMLKAIMETCLLYTSDAADE